MKKLYALFLLSISVLFSHNTNCLPPSNIQISNATTTSVVLNWQPGAEETMWEVLVQPAGSPAPTANSQGIVASTNPFTVTGLTPGGAYSYCVRANCGGNNGVSEWVCITNEPTQGTSCANPIAINSLPFSTQGTTQGLTSSVTGTPGTAAGCGTSGAYLAGPDIFYTFTAPANGPVNIQMTPNGNHSGIFVYNSCANVGVSCVAGQANTNSNIRNFNFNAIAGQTYIIAISTSSSAPNVSYSLVIQQYGCIPPPSALTATNIIQTSATLGWNVNGGATAWEIAVQSLGSGIPSGNGIPVSTNSFLATQLIDGTPMQSATNYQFWVRTNCGNDIYSIWSGPFLFSTAVCEVTSQCDYTFRLTSASSGWNGARMQIIQNGVVVSTIGTTFNSGTQADVTVALCNNVPFEVVWNVAGTFPNNVGLSIVNPSPFNQTIFTKPPGIGIPLSTIYNGLVDCDFPACLTPTEVFTTNISVNSAVLNWTTNGFETQWEVLVLPINSPTPDQTSVGVTTINNPYQISGLESATIYSVYVRSVCGSNVKSDWSLVHIFNTLLCDATNKCEYNFILTDSNNNGWQGNSVSISQNNILVTTIGSSFTTGGGPVSIPVLLCSGVPFEVFWNSGGNAPSDVGLMIKNPFDEIIYNKIPGQGAQNSVLYSGLGNCNMPTCFQPQDIVLTNFTNNSATISWNQQGNPSAWEVYITPNNQPAPSSTNFSIVGTINSNNTFTFNELTSGYIYKVYVRALCEVNSNDISIWSEVFKFTIPATNNNCIESQEITVNNNLNCDLFQSGTFVGSTPSSLATILNCTGNPYNDVWFKFTATSPRQLIKVFDLTSSQNTIKHAVYQGSCDGLNLLFCNNSLESFNNIFTVGNTYYIRVFSTSSNQNDLVESFKICVQSIGAPVLGTSSLNSVPQLINDVFLNSGCAQILNVSSFSANNAGFGFSGIGYFNANNSLFPFQEGLVLSTGNVNNIQGPNLTTLSDGSSNWPGDPQLTSYLNSVLPASTYFNASWVQFDFVPSSSSFTFDYIFASEEYGTFQCNFSDSFAFFISPLDENGNPTNWQNLALTPGTQQPISVVTIRDNMYNTGCPSVNPQFFHTFYGVNGINQWAAPINFNGITVPMSFTANVTPNQNYRIKMVIQDRQDSSYDSAVFIRKGIFNGNTEACNNQFTLHAFLDLNNNGIKDSNELPCPLGTFTYTNSGNTTQLYSPYGFSNILVNNSNAFGFSYQVYPEFASLLQCNTTYSNITYVPNGNNTYWFPVTISQPFTDVSVNVIPQGASPRPGFAYTNKIVVKNNGLFPTSGEIQFLPDTAVTILNVSTTYQSIANGIQINYTNLQPGETRNYWVTMQVPATIALGTVLVNQANITSTLTELLTNNNQSQLGQIVIGSYDPNDKMESHGKEILISEFTSEDYLYYTIRFQNTGTAEAIFVNVYDILDNKLNPSTLQMIDASHAYTLERKGNQLRWNFNNINLVPQSQSEELSQGFIHFKIKPNAGYQVNDIIPNTASIYFDYNDPIITNTFLTKFVQTLNFEEIPVNEFVVYPNPATTTIQIQSSKANIASVEIYDVNGRLVVKVFDQQTILNVNIEALQKGIYLMQIKTVEGETKVVKIMKK